MSNAEARTDIRMQDVFISWTSKDRELKNHIVEYLRSNNITVLESDHDCVGDFRQWSREAVSKCTVFLSLYTENTVHSEYVPVEIEEFKKLDDWRNRCLPVVSDYTLYSEKHPDLAVSESAVILNGREVSDEVLSEILHKVQKLINNRLFKIYRNATQPTYLKLKSFLRMVNVQDREFNYETLYIHRTVTDENENAIDDASVLTTAEDIFFLQGPAGSGKSCYIDQLRKSADENVLVMALPCRNLTDTRDIFKAMFDEFRRHCGNRHFYTEEDFKSLLSVKRLLLVLDGMDEIATKSGTRQFLDAVSEYYKVHASSTTLFFTSRNIDDADIISMNGQSPKCLTLRSFEEDQIKQFGENLFLLLEKPDKSDAFYVRIKELADEIRTNPLLLSQLAIIYDKKDNIPQTTVGIYDAVCEITLSREGDVTNVPDKYRDMVNLELSPILKAFSAERYRLISLGKQIETAKILSKVLKNTYNDAKERAAFLEEYLRDRAMIIDGEFYHKMLLEYFTAVYYYEQCFDDYDEIENEETLKELFSHYDDTYWSDVIQLFLVKADSLTDGETTSKLYETLMTYGITEYTLLFDTCRDLICHKEEAQTILVGDILQKSADGIYPPYGPLFWYIPEYNLYSQLLLSLNNMTEEAYFTKALALTRDVCWIFGHYNTASEITNCINGEELFAKSNLGGIRRGLCEMFFTGDTAEIGGDDIYPRCFNLAEAKYWKEHGCGILGRMQTAFEDELGLYYHEMFSELNGEYIGIVAAPYDKARLETDLPQKSCKKLCGLFFSPTEETNFERLAINDRHIRMMYFPEIIETKQRDLFNKMRLERYAGICSGALIYFNLTITLPKGIKEIPEAMFNDCRSVKSISIPDGVVSIGSHAFWFCSNITSITLPESVAEIGVGAFFYCSSLASINLPSGITKIERGMFEYCRSLKEISIPNGVTGIEAGAFSNCESLVTITIPDTVTEIQNSAFEKCENLETIELSEGISEIPCNVFEGCYSLRTINIPNSVTYIGSKAFSYCASLVSIRLSDKLEEIENDTFEGCNQLKEIYNFPNLGIWDVNAFLDLPVDCIVYYHTESSKKLIELTIDKNLPIMSNLYWARWESRKDVGSVIIKNGVTELGEGIFFGYTALSAVSIPDSVSKIGCQAFVMCSSLTTVELPNSIKTIGKGAFCDCAQLRTINIPDGVTEIGELTFAGCRSLTSIHIPNGVTKIGKGAFKGCISLTSIYIPDSVTEIGEDVFEGCCKLETIDNCPWEYTDSDLGDPENCTINYRTETEPVEIFIKKGTKRIQSYRFQGFKQLHKIHIPDTVTSIGVGAFQNCISLESIIIPKRVTEIGKSAFSVCSALTTIVLPEGVTTIDKFTFAVCERLSSISIPNSITNIGEGAFFKCKSLASIDLPECVIAIEERAFSECSSLVNITIPDSVKLIGRNAFEKCTQLKMVENCLFGYDNEFLGLPSDCVVKYRTNKPTEITIEEGTSIVANGQFAERRDIGLVKLPNGLKEIGWHAFCGCVSLKEITIPDSVTEISAYAFAGCTALTSITIPANVRKIGDNAFASCIGLKEITISRRFEDELPRIFSSVDLSKITIHWI